MYNAYQHPAITRAEREGVPAPARVCACCGEDLGDWAFTIDGGDFCRDCFTEWVQDYLTTNPRELAAALDVPVSYLG